MRDRERTHAISACCICAFDIVLTFVLSPSDLVSFRLASCSGQVMSPEECQRLGLPPGSIMCDGIFEQKAGNYPYISIPNLLGSHVGLAVFAHT